MSTLKWICFSEESVHGKKTNWSRLVPERSQRHKLPVFFRFCYKGIVPLYWCKVAGILFDLGYMIRTLKRDVNIGTQEKYYGGKKDNPGFIRHHSAITVLS